MLSKSLHEQIFGHVESDIDSEHIDTSIRHLEKHNLYGRPKSLIPEVDFRLPSLRGSNIEEHFKIIAEEQTRGYFEMAERLSKLVLPSRPNEWNFEPGWTKYHRDGDLMVGMPVEFPDGDVMVFDVEVCVNEGQFPTMAVLATPDNWYV
jgi:DNA polymerase gamma 1